MKNFMNSVKSSPPGRNAYDLTHDVKLSMNFGYLVPTLAMEVLPGETFTLTCEMLTRFAPTLAPVMHMYNARSEYYFVPNRLCWDAFDDFITVRATPPGAVPAHPYITVLANGSNYTPLMDYIGIPQPLAGQVTNENVNALMLMAYQLIWKNYYCDQTIQAADFGNIPDTLAPGDNTSSLSWLGVMRRRAWPRDYFNSCLPTPQHGVGIEVPIRTGDIPVRKNSSAGGNTTWVSAPANTAVPNQIADGGSPVIADGLFIDGDTIDSDLLVEDIRRASALQRFFEKLMRGGRRLTEVIRAFFGVTPPDARLQRPEYITGVKTPIVISEVLQTGATDPGVTTPQGNMAGHGIGVTTGNYGRYTALEHGWIICVTSVMPNTCYQNGLWGSMTQKTSYLDYFWPELANLGEQPVPYRELFAFTPNGNDTFGYLPIYSRYRTLPSRVCGDFKTTLNFWHNGRIFDPGAPPVLNPDFIQCIPSDRIFAVQGNDDKLWVHINHRIMAVRPVPKFGTPYLY